MVQQSGTLTLTSSGHPTLTCPVAPWSSTYGPAAYNQSGMARLAGIWKSASCNLELRADAQAEVAGALRFTFSTSTSLMGPWGLWTQQSFSVPWTNAVGATPSKVTFNNTFIGFSGFGPGGTPIYATGTLNLTTTAGGQLLLS